MELEIGKVFNDLLLFDKISERTFQRRGVNTRYFFYDTSSRERDGGSSSSGNFLEVK